jgi:Cysteine-rich CPXCG
MAKHQHRSSPRSRATLKAAKPSELERLHRRITQLDGQSIDELYGLEPIWEPSGRARRLAPEEFVAFCCPYCGERLETRVDLTADEPGYVEDCQVCCRPIEFDIERDGEGALAALQVRRLD